MLVEEGVQKISEVLTCLVSSDPRSLEHGLFLNHCIPRHSSRNFPLKLSFAPFCQGLPGSIGAVSIPAPFSHCRTALEMNSGPLAHASNTKS